MKRTVLLTALFSLFIITGAITSENADATTAPIPKESLSPILKPLLPAIVNIAAQGEIMIPYAAQKRDHNGDDEGNPDDQGGTPMPYGTLREFASLGSGVITDANKGYILTNAHVIEKAKTITVTLSDGRTFKAKSIGVDTASDVAVIQIPAEKLTAMPIGDSDKLQVGDYVIAIGNPFGLSQTVTSGIISALQRGALGIEGPQGLENFIQTDASINPGNSGGALINMQGQLIGINTAILSPKGGNVGIGFAIPINMARAIVSQLIEYGAVKRGLMGVIVQDMTPALAKAFGTNDTSGAIITQVSLNSPAAKAGLQPGDIIENLNKQEIKTASDVRNAVGVLRVGANIDLEVLRKGKLISLNLTTSDPDQYIEKAQEQNPFLFGLNLRDFDQQTTLQGHVIGIQIVYVSKNSAAWRAGLMPGDVIVSANQIPVKKINELEAAAQKNKDRLLLNVVRGSGAMFVVLDK